MAPKTRYDLLPMAALGQIADVLAHGAAKYSANNWARGTEWSRYYGAALRHLAAWSQGDDLDDESGLSHLAHAACCLLFLLEYQRNGWGTDDRFLGPDPAPFIKHDGRTPERPLPEEATCCWIDAAGISHCQSASREAVALDDDGLS